MSTHAEFNAPDADIAILSADHILFHLHSANIKAHTTVFPVDSLDASTSDPAQFSEAASVLEVLFKFFYPEPLPSLANISFGLLKDVAYAAHKYQIVAAMAAADGRMELAVEKDPASVFGYACRYFGVHDARLDRLAVHTLDLSSAAMLKETPPEGFCYWVLYRERFTSKILPQYIKSWDTVYAQIKSEAMALKPRPPFSI